MRNRTWAAGAWGAVWLAARAVGLGYDGSGGMVDAAAAVEAARAVTPEAYPNADEVLIDELIRQDYEADGTSVAWDEEYVKVLTEKGKREARTVSFYYSLSYETVEVVRADVIKPDGRVVPVDVASQGRVMIDRSQMSDNIYDPNHKVMTLGLPDLEIGDVYHVLSVRRGLKARVPDTWSDYSVLEQTTPVKHMAIEVVGPAIRPLARIALRDEVAGTVSYAAEALGDRIRHRWDVRDVPRMYVEPRMPPLHTVVQRLLVSTIPDWQSISRWYWTLSKPHLDAVTDDMKRVVGELTANAAGRREVIERLFQFVSQQVRYMGITTETEAPGYEPHDVRVTFENRYGVCRDKAALLVAMLRLAGLPAFPVLIHTGPRKDPDVPQPYFDHAIVAVGNDDGGDYTLMDPTDENTTELLPAYLCFKSYLVAHPDGESLRTSPVYPATNNLMRIATTGRVAADGTLTAESVLRFEGINDNAYRGFFSRMKPEERRHFFEGALRRRVAGAALTGLDLTPADMQDTSVPLGATLRFEARDYFVRGGDVVMVPPPWLGASIGYANFVLGQTGLEKREYPLFSEIACGVSERFSLDLGGSVGEPAAVPRYEPIETHTVAFRQDMTWASNRLEGTCTFLLQTVEFSPADYLELKRMLKDIEYDGRKRAVFAAGAGEEHDILTLLSETTAELDAPDRWAETARVRTRILTYAGKKANAELKLAYNPAWETVSLKAATVTNPDGTVHRVVGAETNLMDAAWVGEAPRYPAAKTLVVSLPGVEIGSVIDYEVAWQSRGKPFFSLHVPFRAFDPVQTNVLRVVAPPEVRVAYRDPDDRRVVFRQAAEGGRTVYEWRSEAQRGVGKEDALPPWWAFNPTVFVSAGDWRVYARAVGEALAAAAARRERTGEVARGLIAGAADPAARAAAIRDYVAKNIRPAGPPLTELPFSCVTPADQTLADRYGNTADRAVVLYAMLDEAGLAPEFVLSSSWAPEVESLTQPLLACPQRGLFDNVLVRVLLDEVWVFLNDTDQYAALGSTAHDGQPGLTLDGEMFTIEAQPEMKHRVEQVYDIEIGDDGEARIRLDRRYFGLGYAGFHKKFAELPPEERRRYFQEKVATVSQAAVAESDLVTDYQAYPGVESFVVRVPRYAVRSGNQLYFTMPGDLGEIMPLRAERRENPLYREGPLRWKTSYRVVLPASVEDVPMLPKDISWQGPGGLGTLTVSSRVVRGDYGRLVIEIAQEADFRASVVPAADYGSLLDLNRRVNHPDARTILAIVVASP